jgi:hypothetical protein
VCTQTSHELLDGMRFCCGEEHFFLKLICTSVVRGSLPEPGSSGPKLQLRSEMGPRSPQKPCLSLTPLCISGHSQVGSGLLPQSQLLNTPKEDLVISPQGPEPGTPQV